MFLKEEKNKRNKVFPPGRLLSFIFVLVGLREQAKVNKRRMLLSRWTHGHVILPGGVLLG